RSGDLDAAGDAVFGGEPDDALVGGVNGGGRVAFGGPSVPEDDVGGDVGGAPAGQAPGEDLPQARGDDVGGGALGGADDDDADRPAPGHDVAQQGGEGFPLGLVADAGGEVGDLVDRQDDRVHPVPGCDLAFVVGHQIGVAVVHHGLQPPQGGDGMLDVGADEHVGRGLPQAELDLFAVDQTQPAVRGQGGVGDDEGQG